MKLIVWVIRILVFAVLLVLAVDNTQTVTLNFPLFPLEHAWTAPLILIGLVFFVAGLVVGLLSALPSLFRLRLENGRVKRDLRAAREAAKPDTEPMPPIPPMPPGV